jgi:hypothetical protein
VSASKWIPILLCALLFGAASGCNLMNFILPQKPLYVAPGQIAEVAKARRVEVIITNKETGKKERRVVEATGDGSWYIGRRNILKESEVK